MTDMPQFQSSPLACVQASPVDVEAVKLRGWNADGILVVAAKDQRLSVLEQALVIRIGNKLYGPRCLKEAHHG